MTGPAPVYLVALKCVTSCHSGKLPELSGGHALGLRTGYSFYPQSPSHTHPQLTSFCLATGLAPVSYPSLRWFTGRTSCSSSVLSALSSCLHCRVRNTAVASQVTEWWRIHLPLQEIEETRVQSLGWEAPLQKYMATHCGIPAWRTPWTEEPGRLQSIGCSLC